jgi:hypothetical protein
MLHTSSPKGGGEPATPGRSSVGSFRNACFIKSLESPNLTEQQSGLELNDMLASQKKSPFPGPFLFL